MTLRNLLVFNLALDVRLRAQLAHEGDKDLIALFSAEHLPEILFI